MTLLCGQSAPLGLPSTIHAGGGGGTGAAVEWYEYRGSTGQFAGCCGACMPVGCAWQAYTITVWAHYLQNEHPAGASNGVPTGSDCRATSRDVHTFLTVGWRGAGCVFGVGVRALTNGLPPHVTPFSAFAAPAVVTQAPSAAIVAPGGAAPATAPPINGEHHAAPRTTCMCRCATATAATCWQRCLAC